MAPRRRLLDTILPLVLLGVLMVLVTVHGSFIPLITGPRHRTQIATGRDRTRLAGAPVPTRRPQSVHSVRSAILPPVLLGRLILLVAVHCKPTRVRAGPIALVPVGLLMGRKKHGSALIGLVTGCLILAAMVGLLSCNSNDSTTPPATNSGGGTPATGTPAGTSSVTVTATSGSSSAGVPVSLTVTR